MTLETTFLSPEFAPAECSGSRTRLLSALDDFLHAATGSRREIFVAEEVSAVAEKRVDILIATDEWTVTVTGVSAEGKAWLYKQTGTNGSFATSFESAEALRVLAEQVGYAVAWSGPRR